MTREPTESALRRRVAAKVEELVDEVMSSGSSVDADSWLDLAEAVADIWLGYRAGTFDRTCSCRPAAHGCCGQRADAARDERRVQ